MVDLRNGLNLIPLISNEIRPPDTHWSGSRGGCGLVGTHRLAGGQEYTSRPLPINEEHINGTLVPQKVQNV